MKKKILFISALLAFLAFAASDSPKFTIHIMGDSTVCNYDASKYPQTGWGQIIGSFLGNANISINNAAIGGRSSKNFYTGGRWALLRPSITAGDYVLIQFGHNDRTYTNADRYADSATFKYYLKLYADTIRYLGATPVFVSPMVMNAWNTSGMRNVFTESGNNYRGWMYQVAQQMDVPFSDLNMKSWNLYKSLGQTYITSFIYHAYSSGDYPNWPDGSADGTHFQENGSVENTRMVVQGIQEAATASYLSDATKAKAAILANVFSPRYQLTVKANIATKGLISRSADFPVGAPVTLRVIPGSGETFEYWADENCNNVSTTKIYYGFKAPGRVTTYTAMFAGGSACVVSGTPTSSASIAISSATVVSSSSAVAVSSSSSATTVTIRSMIDAASPDSGDGTTDTNHEGYTGEGFFNISNSDTSKAYFQLHSDAATTGAVMAIRYSNGSAEDRPMTFVLDGFTYTVSFPPTGSWDLWDTVYVSDVWLDAIDFQMRLESTTANGGPNIDWIGFDISGVTRMNGASIALREANVITTLQMDLNHGVVFSSEEGTFSFQIFDALGHLVYQEQHFLSNGSQALQLNASILSPGTYYVNATFKGKSVQRSVWKCQGRK